MSALMRVQRAKQAFQELVAEAPAMGLADVSTERLEQLLLTSTDDGQQDLRRLLLRSLASPGLARPTSSVQATVQALQTTELGVEALVAYPLDSPAMLSAAKAHGVDERILRDVHAQLDSSGRR